MKSIELDELRTVISNLENYEPIIDDFDLPDMEVSRLSTDFISKKDLLHALKSFEKMNFTEEPKIKRKRK